jgi:hypothetical protein
VECVLCLHGLFAAAVGGSWSCMPACQLIVLCMMFSTGFTCCCLLQHPSQRLLWHPATVLRFWHCQVLGQSLFGSTAAAHRVFCDVKDACAQPTRCCPLHFAGALWPLQAHMWLPQIQQSVELHTLVICSRDVFYALSSTQPAALYIFQSF